MRCVGRRDRRSKLRWFASWRPPSPRPCATSTASTPRVLRQFPRPILRHSLGIHGRMAGARTGLAMWHRWAFTAGGVAGLLLISHVQYDIVGRRKDYDFVAATDRTAPDRTSTSRGVVHAPSSVLQAPTSSRKDIIYAFQRSARGLSGLAGMASAGLWLAALCLEYALHLQPPGDGSSTVLASIRLCSSWPSPAT